MVALEDKFHALMFVCFDFPLKKLAKDLRDSGIVYGAKNG